MDIISTAWRWVTSGRQNFYNLPLNSGRQNVYSLTPVNFSKGVAIPTSDRGTSEIAADHRRLRDRKNGICWPCSDRYLNLKFRAFSLLRTLYKILNAHSKDQWAILVYNQSYLLICWVSRHTQVYLHADNWEDKLDIKCMICSSNDGHERILILIHNWVLNR